MRGEVEGWEGGWDALAMLEERRMKLRYEVRGTEAGRVYKFTGLRVYKLEGRLWVELGVGILKLGVGMREERLGIEGFGIGKMQKVEGKMKGQGK